MIVIVNSGGANFSSIQFALERLGFDSKISNDPEVIKLATHVILPGVNSANTAMRSINEFNLKNILCGLTQPVLGICLGMQILYEHSEEGDVPCLGVIQGNIKKLPESQDLPVPHMGWNTMAFKKECPLLKNLSDDKLIYYVHSYYAEISDNTCAVTEHGIHFSAIVQKDNYFGTQFHPERSGSVGQTILKNFLEC